MKKIKILFFLILCIKFVKSQDTTRYPFHSEMNTNFSEILQSIGNEWMYKDNMCSTGLYFVEIWFDKEAKKPNIFIPDNIPRKFADSIRDVFYKTLFVWDTAFMAKLSTTFIQPIYISDIDCSSNDQNKKIEVKDLYINIFSRESASTKESVNLFFEKLSKNSRPRRYYLFELCIIKDPLRKRKWRM